MITLKMVFLTIAFVTLIVEHIFAGLIIDGTFHGDLTTEEEKKYKKGMWVFAAIAFTFFLVSALV